MSEEIKETNQEFEKELEASLEKAQSREDLAWNVGTVKEDELFYS